MDDEMRFMLNSVLFDIEKSMLGLSAIIKDKTLDSTIGDKIMAKLKFKILKFLDEDFDYSCTNAEAEAIVDINYTKKFVCSRYIDLLLRELVPYVTEKINKPLNPTDEYPEDTCRHELTQILEDFDKK